MFGICGNICGKDIIFVPVTKSTYSMRITITTKDIKSKDKETYTTKAHLVFRLRDKSVDVKVRSDIEVFSDYWDGDALAYRKTKVVPVEEQKRIKTLIRTILDALTDEYDASTADAEWVRDTIDKCLHPKQPSDERLSTVISRMQQYCEEHPMSKGSALTYTPTIKKLQRYEAFMREIEGREDFALYIETIRPEDYLAFREYIINEHVYYDEYPEFYDRFHLSRRPKPLSSTAVIGIMHQLRIVVHWCIRMGYTTNHSCNGFTISAPVHSTPYYLTLEERDRVFHADLSDKPELEIYRDLFMFQSLVGCRAGDLFSLTEGNIIGDLLQYQPHKTMNKRSQTVTVPLNSKAMSIIERYRGKQEKLFPTKNAGLYNKGIRSVLRECGIDRMVTIFDTKTQTEVQKPICDIASSHMARRNFIGNLYKQVKDPELISSMTGHVNGSRAFARYREIDEETKVDLVNLIN